MLHRNFVGKERLRGVSNLHPQLFDAPSQPALAMTL